MVMFSTLSDKTIFYISFCELGAFFDFFIRRVLQTKNQDLDEEEMERRGDAIEKFRKVFKTMSEMCYKYDMEFRKSSLACVKTYSTLEYTDYFSWKFLDYNLHSVQRFVSVTSPGSIFKLSQYSGKFNIGESAFPD